MILFLHLLSFGLVCSWRYSNAIILLNGFLFSQYFVAKIVSTWLSAIFILTILISFLFSLYFIKLYSLLQSRKLLQCLCHTRPLCFSILLVGVFPVIIINCRILNWKQFGCYIKYVSLLANLAINLDHNFSYF